MKKYFWLILILSGFIICYKALADDVQQKTDGSFVGGNDSFMGEDLQKQTDSQFVGDNTVQSENSNFAGQSYQEQVGALTDAPFAQDNSQTPKDGVFVGEDVQKKTDGSFSGDDYGK